MSRGRRWSVVILKPTGNNWHLSLDLREVTTNRGQGSQAPSKGTVTLQPSLLVAIQILRDISRCKVSALGWPHRTLPQATLACALPICHLCQGTASLGSRVLRFISQSFHHCFLLIARALSDPELHSAPSSNCPSPFPSLKEPPTAVITERLIPPARDSLSHILITEMISELV